MNELRDKNLTQDLAVSAPINSVSKSQSQEYCYTVLMGGTRPYNEVDNLYIDFVRLSILY